MRTTPSNQAQVGTVIEALQRLACAARAASNAQREKMRQARVAGTYRQKMAVDLVKLIAYEEGVRAALLGAQEAETALGGSMN
jgi:hypothetical protein